MLNGFRPDKILGVVMSLTILMFTHILSRKKKLISITLISVVIKIVNCFKMAIVDMEI